MVHRLAEGHRPDRITTYGMRIIALVAVWLAMPGAPARADAALDTATRDFMTLCSPCHGASGEGDGPSAARLRKPPADLTRIAAKNAGVFPEEAVFETIAGLAAMDAHGTRDMPVWGDVFVTEAIGRSVKLEDALKASDTATKRIVGLLRYIETIQAKP